MRRPVCWQEKGGSGIQAPGRRGFGLSLVEIVAQGDLESYVRQVLQNGGANAAGMFLCSVKRGFFAL